MEIYKHKTEGMVVFWGACKMRSSSGNWVEATMYRQMQVSKDGQEATVLHNVYAVPTAHWQKHAKKFGELAEKPQEALEAENRAVSALGKPDEQLSAQSS